MMNINSSQTWVGKAWQANLPIYEKTKQLDFVEGIISGKLNKNEFKRYLEQDYLYLKAFTTLLENIKTRIEIPLYNSYFSDFISENMEQEFSMQKTYLQSDSLQSISECAITSSFKKFLKKLESVSIPCALAGILPCFTIYQQLGIYIYKQHNKNNNPFIGWINTYNGIEHAESVSRIIEICNYYANKADDDTIEQMNIYYSRACLLDYYFWTGNNVSSAQLLLK